jgi:hypothetical protein
MFSSIAAENTNNFYKVQPTKFQSTEHTTRYLIQFSLSTRIQFCGDLVLDNISVLFWYCKNVHLYAHPVLWEKASCIEGKRPMLFGTATMFTSVLTSGTGKNSVDLVLQQIHPCVHRYWEKLCVDLVLQQIHPCVHPVLKEKVCVGLVLQQLFAVVQH